jgi:quercetin dioxygenase-like cupin family protein
MRRMHPRLAPVVALLAAALASSVAVFGQGSPWQPPNEAGEGQTPIMPVHEEPHHRQLFQSGPMRIIDLQIPPGDTSWFHTHEWPVFYLTVADSQTRTQVFGEEWGAGRGRGAGPGRGGDGRGAAAPPAPAAAPSAAPAAPAAPRGGAPGGAATGRFRPRLMSDTSYAERKVTHRIGNIGTGLYRAIGVINETPGGDETVTEQAAGFSAKPDSSNRWFRIYRVALAAGEKTQAHQHTAPVVILQDSAGKALASGTMRFEFNEPGQWGYFDAGSRHEIANAGDARVELIEVEVRRR